MELDPVLKGALSELGSELSTASANHQKQDRYYSGECPMPDAVVRANVTRAYRLLMPMAEAPWGSVVVDSVLDRLEVTGIETGQKSTDDALWNVWRANAMDAEANLAHNSALVGGRAYAIVWPTPDGMTPTIKLDSAEQIIVKYAEGSRTERTAALRQWVEDERPFATLYTPTHIYKFQGPKGENSLGLEPKWEMREVPGEPWPLPNRLGVVPVVELAVNRRLKPGAFPFARGEYQHSTGLIDRINLLTFLGLVVAFWMGFPLRGVIGEKILYDDDGNPLKPFDVHADSMFQLENPEAKLAEYGAADRKNLAIYDELDQFAAVTKTPRHYFPMQGGGSNISSDTIIAYEGGLHAKVKTHKGSLGQGWEEVNRIAGRIMGIDVPPTSRITWADHETRSLAERADAATKLKDILPWQAVAEKVLNASPEEIAKWEAQRGSDAFSQLLSAAAAPVEEPVAEPSLDG